MPYYLMQVAYTPEACSALIQNPENRIESIVRPAIERLGGRVVDSWLTFGEYDVILISEMPDNITSISFAMAVTAGGAMKDIKTLPLVTWEDGIEAMRLAGGSGYQPPSDSQ